MCVGLGGRFANAEFCYRRRYVCVRLVCQDFRVCGHIYETAWRNSGSCAMHGQVRLRIAGLAAIHWVHWQARALTRNKKGQGPPSSQARQGKARRGEAQKQDSFQARQDKVTP